MAAPLLGDEVPHDRLDEILKGEEPNPKCLSIQARPVRSGGRDRSCPERKFATILALQELS